MNRPARSRTTSRRRPLVRAATGVALAILLAACGTEKPGATSTPTPVAGADKLAACPSTPSRPPTTGALPDVTLPCLGSGPDIRLADLRGPLVINVWAQWCGPCRDEAPYLANLAKAGTVKMLGIDYDDPRPELAVKFATDEGLTYPHVVDRDKAIQRALKIGGPPLTAFIDKDGAVAFVHRGVLTSQHQLDQLVEEHAR
ncbi:TlpA family protein disulfide reductase [Kribbella pratensis]|uniref:Thiol-disulfide isomerase/thioredoxin n=1 Tax=Kribbella pratensis TaxID=2512112 RepID=A0A4R8C4T4_9ACTN|nr:TlpA disulfide reductase family protein [Kribbella pratensis]TDW70879.1 thiol-disulfide isomerase/thioredoxin [Kribbella pratensis]